MFKVESKRFVVQQIAPNVLEQRKFQRQVCRVIVVHETVIVIYIEAFANLHKSPLFGQFTTPIDKHLRGGYLVAEESWLIGRCGIGLMAERPGIIFKNSTICYFLEYSLLLKDAVDSFCKIK